MTPSPRLLALATVPLGLGTLEFALRVAGSDTSVLVPWWVSLAALLLLSLADLLASQRAHALDVQREAPGNLSQGRWHDVTLAITSRDARPLVAEVFDAVPPSFAVRHQPRALALPPAQVARLTYSVCPQVRGDFAFTAVQLRRRSRLGLWMLRQRIGGATSVRVFPDFSWLSGTLHLVGEQRMQRAGVRLAPRRGEGLEFHQLRDYRAGDAQRQIDWKASARRPTLISREYQEERDQQILMVLDTGSRMRSVDGGLPHFDHVLRAMLLLSFVALRQGDSVGLLSFGGTARWLGMQRGAGAVNALLKAVYDLRTGPVASDYLAVARDIRLRQRRRALVVLLTNAREEDHDLQPALELLRARHIVLVTSLREAVLDDIDHSPVQSLEDALRQAAVSATLVQRQRTADALRRDGHIMLDCTAKELPVRLVHDYWQLKRSGRL